MIIYYNARCSKCREALQLLEENSCEVEIRNYLEYAPTVEELKQLTQLLNCSAIQITRTKEPLFVEKYEGKRLSEEKLFKLLSKNPILIERPIVIDGKRAIVGRPPQLVLELVKVKKRKK